MKKISKRFDDKRRNEDSRIQITLTKSEKEEWEKFLKQQKKNGKTSIRIRIDSDMKESWRNFVDKSDKFKNLSQLIRTAVNDFIFSHKSKCLLEDYRIRENIDFSFDQSLKLIDNSKNYQRVKELREIVEQFDRGKTKDLKKEQIQKKLLAIRSLLLKIILEIWVRGDFYRIGSG